MEPFRFTVALQTKLFLYAIVFGAALGILYDLFRILRMSFSSGKVMVFFQDVTYGAVSGFLMYLFCFIFNNGEVRAYLLIGSVLGFIIYYFSVGSIVMKVSRKTVKGARRVKRWIVRVVGRPFRWIFGKLSKHFSFLSKVSKKKRKKFTNKYDLGLKQTKVLLYNLLKASVKTRKKEGEGNAAQNEDQKT